MRYALHSTPVGSLLVIADDDGVVHASGWTTDVDALVRIIRPSLWLGTPALRRDLGAVSKAIGAYLEGEVAAIDDIAVSRAAASSESAHGAYSGRYPPGRTLTYGELAARCGRPNAVRAAGSACARNAVSLFVPCHRVLRSDGSRGGFGSGLGVKRWLLTHEQTSTRHTGSMNSQRHQGVRNGSPT